MSPTPRRRRRSGAVPYTPPPPPPPLPPSTPEHPHLMDLIDRILEAADRLVGATKRVETSLPGQLSASVEAMVAERREFERLLTTAAQDEMRRIQMFRDTPLLVTWNGRRVEDMDAEELRRVLLDFPEGRRMSLESFDSPFYRPAPWETRLKLAEAYDAFAIRAQARLVELTT